MDVKGKFLLQL